MGLAKKEFLTFMEKFDDCPFEIEIEGEKNLIGTGDPAFSVIFHKTPSVSDLVTSTSIALGEAYMNGDIEIRGDLYETLHLFLGQIAKFSTDQKKLKKLIYPSKSKKNQKKEVCSHYDLGNDFYRLWLDETMSYSCGYFCSPEDTLYQAQKNKVDYILKKLCLEKGMRLLDIGCGWGFLLIEAAKKYGIQGTGITLSEEQYAEFQKRIKKEHMENQLEVKLMDYRDLSACRCTFDRVVSVGGLFLLHYISALKEYPGDAWIKKYIFPGGVIPSLREILHIAGEQQFYTVDVESLRRHYNKTLLCWYRNFQEHQKEAAALFDEQFVRMWELYLCACAAAFMNGVVDLHQILFTNGVNNELPMTRWY